MAFISSRGTYFASITSGGLFRSTDRGRTWKLILRGNGSKIGLRDVGFIEMVEDEESGVIYAGTTRGLWFSKDDGLSWKRIKVGFRGVDTDDPDYMISSIVLVNKTIFMGLKNKRRQGVRAQKMVLEYDLEKKKLIFHPIPRQMILSHSAVGMRQTIMKLDYDDNFDGHPTLFVSDFSSGYYMMIKVGNRWIWERIPSPTDKPATGIRVNRRRDIVFLQTYGDWIYVGRKDRGRWIWKHLKKTSEGLCKLVHDLKIDPFNEEKIWFGCGCGLTSIFPRPNWLSNGFGWGIFDYERMKFKELKFFKYPATQISFDLNHSIRTKDGRSAKYILASLGGANPDVIESDDGGYRWRKDNEGMAGETINNVLCIETSKNKEMVFQLAVSMNTILPSPDSSWKYFFRLRESKAYTRDAVVLEDGRNTLEILVATGYPTRKVETTGLFRLTLSKRSGKPVGKPKKLLTGPIYRLLRHPEYSNYMVLARGDCKVQVYDLRKDKVVDLSDGLPKVCGVWDLEIFSDGSHERWFASVFFRDLSKNDFDMANYLSRGAIYMIDDPLRSKKSRWIKIYSGSSRNTMISAILLSPDRELFALRSDGTVVYSPDLLDLEFHEKKLKIPEGAGKGMRFFTDLEIDFDAGIVFISSMGKGIFRVKLEDLRRYDVVKVEDYNDDIGTLLIRNMSICPVSNYIFAGTQAESVWRRRYK